MDLSTYFRENNVANPTRVDEVLALLRINTPESLAEAERAVGRPVTRCPPAIPPWPPKPVSAKPRAPVVQRVLPSPSKKQQMVKPGWTEEQIVQRVGATRRDVRHWIKQGYLVVA